MTKLTLDVNKLRVVSFEIPRRAREDGAVEAFTAWSDESVCPTTAPSDRRPCA